MDIALNVMCIATTSVTAVVVLGTRIRRLRRRNSVNIVALATTLRSIPAVAGGPAGRDAGIAAPGRTTVRARTALIRSETRLLPSCTRV